MRIIFLILLIILTTRPDSAVATGELTLSGNNRWVVLASRQSPDEAMELARNYGREIRGVRVLRSSNGWFAIVAGPVSATNPSQAKAALNTALYLPSDLYVSRGEPYVETAWTAPEPAVLGGVRYEGTSPARMQREGTSVLLEDLRQGDGNRVPTAIVRVGSDIVLVERIEEGVSENVNAQARFVQLDRNSPRPQVVFSYFWGGAHCCTVTRILTASASGQWTSVPAPTSDGDGFSFEDVDGDGTVEPVDIDGSFLYAFDSYAGSFAPPAVYRLVGKQLRNVSLEPALRPYLSRRLERWERLASEHPDLWRSNGFLAGWVAAKSQLGQVAEAWPRMLAQYDRNLDFGPSECVTGQPIDSCPQANTRKIPFPDALRAHLFKHGYPVPAGATAQAERAPPAAASFVDAKAAFDRLPAADKYERQMLLIAAGNWPAVSTDQFSRRLFDAILKFQADNGLPRTGIMDGQPYATLQNVAAPVLRRWSLHAIRHPVAAAQLWVPDGLGLTRSASKSGVVFDNGSLHIGFDYFPGIGLDVAYTTVVDGFKAPIAINFKTLRRDFFVVAAGQDDAGSYVRFHAISGGIVGFNVVWKSTDEGVKGDRLSTLMSDLFRASVSLGQDRAPPSPATVVTTAPQEDLRPTPPSALTPGERRAPTVASTGSGFFVTAEGHILTNAHVVDGCSEIRASYGDTRARPAAVLAKDGTNDLALVKTEGKPPEVAAVRPTVRLGEPVAAFGFPLTGLLAAGGNFTLGNVTALAGLRDDSRMLQISAPVQPGNSGGPLLDESGAVVGVVVSKLNALKLALATDDIPQNINFAIKGGVAAGFAEEHGVKLTAQAVDAPVLRPADLADRAKSFTVLLECLK